MNIVFSVLRLGRSQNSLRLQADLETNSVRNVELDTSSLGHLRQRLGHLASRKLRIDGHKLLVHENLLILHLLDDLVDLLVGALEQHLLVYILARLEALLGLVHHTLELNGALVFHDTVRHAVKEHGLRADEVHGQAVSELGHLLARLPLERGLGLDRDHGALGASVIPTLVVQVAAKNAVLDGQRRNVLEADVLADGRGAADQALLDGLTAGPVERSSEQLLGVLGAGAQRGLGHLAHKVLELGVAGHKVGFRADLHE
mmetsp:Transcript_14655/g.37095  ORF Transcript_14655/g.37095 Transcript_14655/m.37095 type:complete len:259 (+) Transcript_14655:41-817(+)